MTIPPVELVPGYTVSRLIKGGWQTIGRGADAIDDLLAFVEAGVTTFETSDSYAGGEELMGVLRKAVHDRMGQDVAETLRLHTRYTAPLSGAGPSHKDVVRSVDRSLERLGVERLDLLQLQWWNPEVPGLVDTALALADLRHQGKIGLIGVANFGVTPLERLLGAGVPVATNQVLYSLIDRRPENRLAAYCRQRDIGLMTFAPLAGSFLSERWLGARDPRDEGTKHSAEYRALIDAGGGWRAYENLLAVLAKVAKRHDCSIATLALAWTLQRGPGAAVLFGASGPRRLPETVAAFGIALTDEDVAEIEASGYRRSKDDVGELERAPDSVLMRAIRASHDG